VGAQPDAILGAAQDGALEAEQLAQARAQAVGGDDGAGVDGPTLVVTPRMAPLSSRRKASAPTPSRTVAVGWARTAARSCASKRRRARRAVGGAVAAVGKRAKAAGPSSASMAKPMPSMRWAPSRTSARRPSSASAVTPVGKRPSPARFVAREARAVDEQHLEAAARAGQRGGAAGRSAARHYHVDDGAHDRPVARGDPDNERAGSAAAAACSRASAGRPPARAPRRECGAPT